MKTNPLNIRYSHEVFQGELVNNTNFKTFINRTYGVRAAMKIINHYCQDPKCNTVSDIISRWAPPCENNTEKYIEFVIDKRNVLSRDTVIDPLHHKLEFCLLIQRMAIYESNIHLTNKVILDAYKLAFPSL